MPQICSLDNLYEAFLRAAKGKSQRSAVIAFRQHLEENLLKIRDSLAEGTFQFGQYHFFVVYDPKKRKICAASFPERVAFHALMRICHPVFDDFQISDSYASRIGKGGYKALEKAQYFCAKYEWFVKLDVKKFFDSISHHVLIAQLCRLFKDPLLLSYFSELIRGYEVTPCRGLPIGNLTSQYFANHYLSVADHYAKEKLHIPAMVRYMDDILIFAQKRIDILVQVKELTDFLHIHLLLESHQPVVNRTRFGVPFLGYVVYKDKLRLNGRSRKRLIHKLAALSLDLQYNIVSESEYATRATCLMAFADKATAMQLKQKMTKVKGLYPQGL